MQPKLILLRPPFGPYCTWEIQGAPLCVRSTLSRLEMPTAAYASFTRTLRQTYPGPTKGGPTTNARYAIFGCGRLGDQRSVHDFRVSAARRSTWYALFGYDV